MRYNAIVEVMPLFRDERGLTLPLTGALFELGGIVGFLADQLPAHTVVMNAVQPATHAPLHAVRCGASMAGAVDMLRSSARPSEELLEELAQGLGEREAAFPNWKFGTERELCERTCGARGS
ncbi:hypothetical protein [Gemmata sp.]|uniref:hypothetical protein n=1 Tax=Gemmata sp. TaxID=1914242 RepID=UPI003F72D59F